MTKKNQLLTDIYTSKELSDCLKKVDEGIRDDLRQYVFEKLLEKPDEFIIELHENRKLNNYIVSMIFRMVHYKKDKFYSMTGRGTAGQMVEINTDFAVTEVVYDDDADLSFFEKNNFNLFKNSITHNSFEDSEQKLIDNIEKAKDKVYWYNKELFELYVKLGTYKAVSDKVGISTMSVFNAVKKAKQQIRELCTK